MGRVPGGPKNVAADHAHLVLIDETGLFLNPTVRRSWALIGYTPVIDGDGGHRRKVSVIGAVTVSPAAQRLGFYFATPVDGYFSAERVVTFLRDLLRHLPGKVVVIWDGGGNHKGPAIRAARSGGESRPGSRPVLFTTLTIDRRVPSATGGSADLPAESARLARVLR